MAPPQCPMAVRKKNSQSCCPPKIGKLRIPLFFPPNQASSRVGGSFPKNVGGFFWGRLSHARELPLSTAFLFPFRTQCRAIFFPSRYAVSETVPLTARKSQCSRSPENPSSPFFFFHALFFPPDFFPFVARPFFPLFNPRRER